MVSSARRRGAFFLALLGILSLIAALTPGLASAASVEPVEEPFPGGPVTCPAGLTGLRIDNAASNYEVDDVRFSVSVTNRGGNESFDFWVTSDHLVAVVFVKGGPPRNVYTYPSPGVVSDTYLHAPTNPNSGKWYDISHIDFCFTAVDDIPVEPETYLVIPQKSWVEDYGEGFSADITVGFGEGEGERMTWSFDHLGRPHSDEALQVPVSVALAELDVVETARAPDGWSCDVTSIDRRPADAESPAVIEVTNICEQDEVPEPEDPILSLVVAKQWAADYGEGFSAEITLGFGEGEGESVTWSFDHEGTRDHDEPLEVPESRLEDLVLTEDYTAPEGWVCAIDEGEPPVTPMASEVTRTIVVVNVCEDTTTPTDPDEPETPTDPDEPETPDTDDPDVGGIVEEPEEEIVDEPEEEAIDEPEVEGIEEEEAVAGTGTLPRTGATSLPLAVAGFAALLGGVGLTRLGTRAG